MTGIDLDAIRARIADHMEAPVASESDMARHAAADLDALCDEVERLRTALDGMREIISVRDDAASRVRAAVATVRALHQDAGPSQGYYPDDGSSYGWTQHACTSCGTPGEYGIPYPCPTIQALDREDSTSER